MTKEPTKDIRGDITADDMVDYFVLNHDGCGMITYPDGYTYLVCKVDEVHDILVDDYSVNFICAIPVDDFAKLKLWFIKKIHAPLMVKGLSKKL